MLPRRMLIVNNRMIAVVMTTIHNEELVKDRLVLPAEISISE